MKIIDGIKLKGRPVEIPDCGRDSLPEFFKEMGYKVGAEIGVYRGEFTEKLCKRGLKIYGIDPWLVYDNYKKHPDERDYEDLFKNTVKKLKSYDCTIIRKTSLEALADIPDESLDFVYIDANHLLPYVIQDIYEWNKKVRKGGIISGHDYVLRGKPYGLRACHAKYAVDLCAKIFGVENYYIIGNKNPKEGEIRDRSRSWFWIKN